MTSRSIRLLTIVLTICGSQAIAREEIYLIVNNRIIRIIYYEHELAALARIIRNDADVTQTNDRPEEAERYRRYSSVQSFLVDYNEGLHINFDPDKEWQPRHE